jgi:hypothetical protein
MYLGVIWTLVIEDPNRICDIYSLLLDYVLVCVCVHASLHVSPNTY